MTPISQRQAGTGTHLAMQTAIRAWPVAYIPIGWRRKTRVCAARLAFDQISATAPEIDGAEQTLRDLSQPLLFHIDEGQSELDKALAQRGYHRVDLTDLLAQPVADLCDQELPKTTLFDIWPPLIIQKDIWALDGVGPQRMNVMDRATQAKTSLLIRWEGARGGHCIFSLSWGCDHGACVNDFTRATRTRSSEMGDAQSRIMGSKSGLFHFGRGLHKRKFRSTKPLFFTRDETCGTLPLPFERGSSMTSKPQVTALNLPPMDPLPEATQKYFDMCEEKLGMVPNVLQAHAFDVEKLDAFSGLYNSLMLAPGGLSKLEREMIAVVVSSVNRCFYCLTAHGAAIRALSKDPILGRDARHELPQRTA